jgi:hypothetical protein
MEMKLMRTNGASLYYEAFVQKGLDIYSAGEWPVSSGPGWYREKPPGGRMFKAIIENNIVLALPPVIIKFVENRYMTEFAVQ